VFATFGDQMEQGALPDEAVGGYTPGKTLLIIEVRGAQEMYGGQVPA